jgi:hypothetical protein
MQKDDEVRREEAAEEKAEVNPAARRDRPGSPSTDAEAEEDRTRQVPPVQEEPLDPLGPGGIGA